uniref:Uncharacterized protein n=1 Tax=Rhizophora mucronata TaxID=61149 RepID=A0A2P2PES7_RHIMU
MTRRMASSIICTGKAAYVTSLKSSFAGLHSCICPFSLSASDESNP